MLLIQIFFLQTAFPAGALETEQAEIKTYRFSPGERMYLAGIQEVSHTDGVCYTLCDRDRDGTEELLVRSGGEDAEDKVLTVFRYDAAADAAVPDRVLRGDMCTDFLSTLSGNGEELIWVDGRQWADGSVIGAAQAAGDPRVREDFYLSSGYEWLSKTHIEKAGEECSPTGDLQIIVEQNKEAMLMDREKYQGEDIRRLRDYYDLATDWEKRNADGAAPVCKYLEAVERAGSIPELTDYLTDPEANPFCRMLSLTVTLDEKNTKEWAAEIGEDSFSVMPRVWQSGDEEYIEAQRTDFDTQAESVLARAGYDADAVSRILRESRELEDLLLPYAWPGGNDEQEELYGFQPYEKVAGSCSHFPLRRLLEACGITDGTLHVYYPAYLRQLDSLYTERNLSLLKSYLLAHTAGGNYSTEMSREEKLAGLGEIIGHELTHAFDQNGIRYDGDGNLVLTEDNPCGWMPEKDYQTFQERAGKIADYFDSICPFPNASCPGAALWGEAAADMGGMSVCLKIAGKEKEFDSDSFFRDHTRLWLKQTTLSRERGDLYDPHPLAHLRINVTLQQFDVFFHTYGIREGDRMYLAPEDRILIW